MGCGIWDWGWGGENLSLALALGIVRMAAVLTAGPPGLHIAAHAHWYPAGSPNANLHQLGLGCH